MADLLPVADYVERILATVSPLPAFPQPLMEALGLALAEDVVAPISLPSFDNSAMDGYAVVADDVAGASDDAPVILPVVGEIGAGQSSILALSPGTAVKIMTGAPVPAGATTVVPYEWTDRGVASVRISRAAAPGQHIRPTGDDISEGDMLLEEGTVLGPRHLGMLAAVGRATVRTRPRPRVVVISTGSELRDPGTQLGRDSIYDGNSYLLAAAARAAGAIAYRVGIVPDEPHAFSEALQRPARPCRPRRHERRRQRGRLRRRQGGRCRTTARCGSAGSAMQPGKPQGFGTVGEDDTPIFTLPGNPVSSYVSFEMFVLPAIRRMMGKLPYVRPAGRARLTHGLSSPEGRRAVRPRPLRDRPRRHRSSRRSAATARTCIGDLAQANCLIVVPAEHDRDRRPATMVAVLRARRGVLMAGDRRRDG